jgi:L-fuconolactonase
MTIDAHQHFWHYDAREYGWIGEDMKVLRRNFLPGDLRPLLRGSGIDGTVAVQARQTLAETEWLLDLAEQHEFIRGVVGWVPLTDPCVEAHLERFAGRPLCKGMRHVLQDEADDFYMLRADFNAGITKLKDFGLVYDILIYERHLEQTIEFVDRHPDQVFVLDHVAKPRIRERKIAEWRVQMEDLATRENVFCKLSGMVTEADWKTWSTAALRPYFDVVLNAFTPNRLLFGSDWPVLRLAAEYGQWVDLLRGEISGLSESERSGIMGGNAVKIYRL